ncbi:MAG: exodeoxyribonuclease VII large subunit [Candidatus Howiella sp.]|jgi:exodeoxyribonuclease VII large subunit
MAQNLILSVTQLNRYVRSLLEEDPGLTFIFVTGEISNFKAHYASGHCYFSLKDDGGVIRSVMFRSAAIRLKWKPENGMKVICRGRVSLYERDGQYQLYVDDMQPDGLGALTLAAEQLRKKLAGEGLFDEENKQPLPKYPSRIAVLTSATGAAVRDICSVLSRRWPPAEILLCPVTVQGEGAAAEISAVLDHLSQTRDADLIILGRGGGSAEDLDAFNQEVLVRSVAACPIPVISAVGHETDYTLCDLAADLRAPTPSAAAELAVPDKTAVFESLRDTRSALKGALSGILRKKEAALQTLRRSPALKNPQFYAEQQALRLDGLSARLLRCGKERVENAAAGLGNAAGRLHALSPLAVLGRGYSLTYKDGRILTDAGAVSLGDRVEIRLAAGSLDCRVTERKIATDEENSSNRIV